MCVCVCVCVCVFERVCGRENVREKEYVCVRVRTCVLCHVHRDSDNSRCHGLGFGCGVWGVGCRV